MKNYLKGEEVEKKRKKKKKQIKNKPLSYREKLQGIKRAEQKPSLDVLMPARALVNWSLLLSSILWAGFAVVMYVLYRMFISSEEFNSDPLKGKKWIWE